MSDERPVIDMHEVIKDKFPPGRGTLNINPALTDAAHIN